MTKDDRITCSLCAWRGTCAKKFSISASDLLHCTDYTRDLTIGQHVNEDPVKTDDVDEEERKHEG